MDGLSIATRVGGDGSLGLDLDAMRIWISGTRSVEMVHKELDGVDCGLCVGCVWVRDGWIVRRGNCDMMGLKLGLLVLSFVWINNEGGRARCLNLRNLMGRVRICPNGE